jgi:hypothetical protein
MTNAIKVLLQMTTVSLQPVPSLNKCHLCQTAENSNFTLIQMVYFFQHLFSPGFHLNA